AYEGYHFSHESELVFDAVEIHYSNLEDWFEEKAPNPTITRDPETRKVSHVAISRTSPKGYVFSFPRFDLKFSFRYESKNNIREASLTLSRVAQFSYPSLCSIETIFDDEICLRNFISLGLGRSSYPISITLTSSNLTETKFGIVSLIPIVAHVRFENIHESIEYIHPFKMLFSFEDIQDKFSEIYRLWIDKYDRLIPTIHSYFAALESPSEYSIDRFLSLTTAVESYHRRTHAGLFLPAEDFESVEATMKETIPPHLPADMKQSIEGRIHYFNEVSQNKRYKELIATYSSDFGKEALVLLEDSKRFIALVLDTRNFYTHFDGQLEGKAATGLDLMVLINKLLFVLDLAFLREIEISGDQVIALLKRTSKYQFLKYYRKWHPDYKFL
ncbi:MAG TPA: hypothetical protein HA263_10685, partial [Methanoregulaceae archaeon]|nr:hypothetical protein [Methanoregulaceae archaeon]